MAHREGIARLALGLTLLGGCHLGWAAESARPPVVEPVFGPRPRVATTPAELASLRSSQSFEAVQAAVVRQADALLAAPPPLPDGPGNWIFYYACPADGARLRAVTAAKHECPACGKAYTDRRTVEAYRCLQHNTLDSAALQLASAYTYTGEERYAAGTQRILLFLADTYDSYPGRRDRWGRHGILAPLGGRRYVQSLDEAYGVIPLAKAYDLTCEAAVWTADQRRHVEEDFLRLTARTLLRFNQDINNHQTWYNAGLMAIGSALGDADLVRQVLTMRGGYYDQMARSLGDDGLWYEGTMAYQRYALGAILEIVDVGRRLGLPLHEHPRLKALILSPALACYPDGSFPVINDSDPATLAGFDESFEWAWKAWGDERFAQARARGDSARLEALIGRPATATWPLTRGTVDFPDLGLLKLEAGQGSQAACVFLDYGPHGGGHGHFDKLGITLFAGGREWLLDPGRLSYSVPEYKTWVKTTAAHNTVTVNGRDQAATAGRLLWTTAGEGWTAGAAECDSAYPEVLLRRHLVLTPDFLLDVFDVRAEPARTVDLLVHAQADRVEPQLGTDPPEGEDCVPGERDGYPHLTGGKAFGTRGAAPPSRWAFVAGGLAAGGGVCAGRGRAGHCLRRHRVPPRGTGPMPDPPRETA